MRLTVLEPYADPLVTEHAHNIVLQTLADGGVLLFLALAAVAIAYVAVWHARRRDATDGQHLALCVLAGVAAGFMLDHLTAFNAVIGMSVVLAAIALPASRAKPQKTFAARWAALPVGALLLVATPSIIGNAIGRLQSENARHHFLAGEIALSRDSFESALSWAPTSAAYQMGAGLTYSLLGETQAAITHFRAAAKLSPGDPRAYGALGHLLEGRERLETLSRASVISHGNPEYAALLGKALEADGEIDAAERAYAIAAAIDPPRVRNLASFSRAVTLDDLFEQLPTALKAIAPQARITVEHVYREFDLMLDVRPPDQDPAWLAVWHARHSNRGEAIGSLEEARITAPYDPSTWAAYEAAGTLLCDPVIETKGQRVLALTREVGRVGAELWDPVHREQGLGDYQSAWPAILARPERSPLWVLESSLLDCATRP
jgi:tetratricopeptide (TPR) repeat protein